MCIYLNLSAQQIFTIFTLAREDLREDLDGNQERGGNAGVTKSNPSLGGLVETTPSKIIRHLGRITEHLRANRAPFLQRTTGATTAATALFHGIPFFFGATAKNVAGSYVKFDDVAITSAR